MSEKRNARRFALVALCLYVVVVTCQWRLSEPFSPPPEEQTHQQPVKVIDGNAWLQGYKAGVALVKLFYTAVYVLLRGMSVAPMTNEEFLQWIDSFGPR